MKRYISLLLILTLTVCMMTTPVSAAESSIGYVDLMQYGGILYDGELYEDFKFTPIEEGRGYFEFPVGLSFAPGYVELLIFTGSELTLYNNSVYQYKLAQSTSIISDAVDRYKVYTGDIRGTLQEEDTFRIYFDYALGTYTPEIRILSAKILPYHYEPINVPFDYSWFEDRLGDYDSDSEVFNFSIFHDAWDSDAVNRFTTEVSITFNPEYLLGMDYIDLTIFSQNLEFTSISADINGIALPVEYTSSFMGDGVLGWVTSLEFTDFTTGLYRTVVRLDVSGISTLYPGDWPSINFAYTASTFHTIDPVFAVDRALVGKLWTQSDPQVSWLTKIYNALTSGFDKLNDWIDNQTSSIVAAIRNDDYEVDEGFNSAVQEEVDELQQMQAVMDSVQRPDINSVNVSVDRYVSQADVVTLTSPFTVLLTGNVFGPIVIMTILFATVSYVLYGKR